MLVTIPAPSPFAMTSDDTSAAAGRAGSVSDRAAQAALFDTCFGRSDGAEVLPWRYDASPHGDALTHVVDGDDDRLVASYACGPRTILNRGADGCAVGQTGDVMTAKEARGRGLFSGLDRATMERAREAGWPVVFGLPNRVGAHLRPGPRLGGGRRAAALDLRPLRRCGRPCGADEGEPPRERRRAVDRVARDDGPGKLRKSFFGKINVVPIARFKPEADEVAAAVAREHPWFVRRDHEDLNWRFIDAPSGRFRAHGVYEPSGAMRGLVRRADPRAGRDGGAHRGHRRRGRGGLRRRTRGGPGHLRKAGASVARAHAVVGSAWETRLKRSGFRAPSQEDTRPIILRVLDPAHPLTAIARDPKSWYFTDGDRDAELIG